MKIGRDKLRRSKAAITTNEDLRLENLIPAVAAKAYGYNLFNIWDLTLYQFYDQFSRINSNFSLDIASTRWAIWGEDAYDCDPWYTDVHKQ